MSVDQPGRGRQSFVEFIYSSDKIQDSEANGEFENASTFISLNTFLLKERISTDSGSEENNSERPVDALAVKKGESLTF